jgi:hypothetical protein
MVGAARMCLGSDCSFLSPAPTPVHRHLGSVCTSSTLATLCSSSASRCARSLTSSSARHAASLLSSRASSGARGPPPRTLASKCQHWTWWAGCQLQIHAYQRARCSPHPRPRACSVSTAPHWDRQPQPTTAEAWRLVFRTSPGCCDSWPTLA